MNTTHNRSKNRTVFVSSLILLSLALSACSTNDEDQYISRDVEVLYNMASDRLGRRQYTVSAALFDEVERQHPYSPWARRAQLMAAYSHYEANQYEDAILAAERFLSLHPGNKDAPYAYYLIALCHYEQITDVGRDQRTTQMAMRALQEVVRRFPESQYARDSQLKLDLTRDHLAGKEMEVGRFYQSQGQYLASIGRFSNVITSFQTTSHVPEALHRLVEVYLALGVETEAQTIAAVLGYNFPNNKWYNHSYKLLRGEDLEPVLDERSFFGKVFGIF